MRRFLNALLAALLALAPAGAGAQANREALILFGKTRPALDLNFQTGTLPGSVSFTRASAATDSFYTDAAGSSFNSYSSGVARVLAAGYLSEESRVQRLLNSAAPVTQTTASLATGTYVFWCIGTGTTTSSAGTATASGLGAITCSQSTFQTIVVTVTGTLTFTISGSVNRFQLELGPFPSSFISSAGAALTRSADVASVSLVLGSSLTLYVAGIPNSSATATQVFLSASDGTTSNRFGLYRSPSLSFLYNASGNGVDGTVWNPGVAGRFIGASSSGAQSFTFNGSQVKKTTVSGTITGLNKVNIGSGEAGTFQCNCTISRAIIWNSKLPNSVLPSKTS